MDHIFISKNNIKFKVVKRTVANTHLCYLVDLDLYRSVVINDVTDVIINPYIFKVGYIKASSIDEYNHSLASGSYSVWANMIDRCYSGKNVAYKGVSVCDEWHNFITFAEWHERNYVDGWSLDKDLFSIEDKTYSPSTCCYVPMIINSALRRKITIKKDMYGYYFLDSTLVESPKKVYGYDKLDAYRLLILHRRTYMRTLVHIYSDKLDYRVKKKLIHLYDKEGEVLKNPRSSKTKRQNPEGLS